MWGQHCTFETRGISRAPSELFIGYNFTVTSLVSEHDSDSGIRISIRISAHQYWQKVYE